MSQQLHIEFESSTHFRLWFNNQRFILLPFTFPGISLLREILLSNQMTKTGQPGAPTQYNINQLIRDFYKKRVDEFPELNLMEYDL